MDLAENLGKIHTCQIQNQTKKNINFHKLDHERLGIWP
jgi:hypothetical protein